MMPTLHELQSAFRGALLTDDPSILTWIDGGRLGPEALLRIHRNNVANSMLDVLESAFPAVRALMGEHAFAYAGYEYLRLSPPDDPCLFSYGLGFPAHLEHGAVALEKPPLADLARLEWAIHAAGHAPDAGFVELAALAELDNAEDACLRFHPACAYLASPWPVDEIWQNIPDGVFPETTETPVRLEIRREGERVISRRLDAASWQLRRDLCHGAPLGHAVEAVLAIDPDVDLGTTLAELFAASLITQIIADETALKEGHITQ